MKMEIIQKPIYRHFLLFFNTILMFFGLFGVKSTFCSPKAAGVPIVMILSESDPGVYKKADPTDDPVYNTFVSALNSHQNILISPPILYWLIKRSNEHRGALYDWASKLQNDYALFLTKDEGFVLIVPSGQKADPAALGINVDYLSEPLVTAASIKGRLSNNKYSHQPICPEQLAQLFIKNSFLHPVPPKYFYITGHGLDSIDDAKFEWCGASIAEMPVYRLVNLLEILNKINTRLVYLLSCYASGSNALKLQNILSGAIKDERCVCLDTLEFPVLFQSSMDIVACPLFENLPQLFSAIEAWDCEDADSIDCLAQKVGDQFIQVTPRIKRFANYPTIRMPKTSHFRALPLQSTIVIAEPISAAKTIEAPTEKEMIQVYPADLSQLTVHMPDADLATFISRVHGRAHHFIGSIMTDATGPIPNIIFALFLCGVNLAGQPNFYCGVSDKAWFIEKLKIADNDEIHGVAIFKGSLKYTNHEPIVVYRTTKNEYFRLTIPLPFEENSIKKERIDEATYIQTIKEIYWQTLSEQDALEEATNKSESQIDHNALFIEFGKKLDIVLSLPSDDEIIQKDFAQIKSGHIKKENYIDYAAHIHHEPLIDAIVEHGIKNDIFDTDDINFLLYKLIEHEYQPLIFKQLQKLADQSEQQVLFCVENVFRHCLDVGLYKHALQMYDDLFICLKKALSPNCKKDLLAAIQRQLIRFVVMLVEHDCAQNAVDKVLELLNSSDLGMQVIGLILFTTMEKAGFTNEKLNQKRTLLHAIALNLKKAARSHNAVALYFYEQALVRQCIACLTARTD